jgi:tRNA-dihydrouridine synthase
LEAAREGWGQRKKEEIPISVKTRIGYNSVDWRWLRLLLEQNLPALTVHLRTRKEMSNVPAHWDMMPEIVKLRDEVQASIPINERTLIIGNGDIVSLEDAKQKFEKYGCDGVMVGRGVFGKPWFFSEAKKEGSKEGKMKIVKENKTDGIKEYENIGIGEKTPEERLKIMLEHAKLFNTLYCGKESGKGKSIKANYKNFAVMKKHFKAYVSGWEGAKELRVLLMEAENYKQVEVIVKKQLANLKVKGVE